MLVPPPPKIESQFFITGHKTSKAIITVLTILLIMFTLIPLISTGFILISGEGIGPGIFIFFLIFCHPLSDSGFTICGSFGSGRLNEQEVVLAVVKIPAWQFICQLFLTEFLLHRGESIVNYAFT